MPQASDGTRSRGEGPFLAPPAIPTRVEKPSGEEPVGRFSAYCRARSTRVLIEVLDISTTGCLLDLRTWGLRAGERILIRLPGLAYLSAVIVWVEDGRGGITFDQPLHEAVLRHLMENSSSG
ncbi:PilZ domain-containing protein [Novosphingobium sp. PC22D]|uniref:PilZ domain-containing protein n=1 Tax=Novosphingobium sp. PC22D TaxID=1962403 RepID=UPI000BF1B68F|nr:PilZ domain-containing protein [Novosphingobium sp. PC22D]